MFIKFDLPRMVPAGILFCIFSSLALATVVPPQCTPFNQKVCNVFDAVCYVTCDDLRIGVSLLFEQFLRDPEEVASFRRIKEHLVKCHPEMNNVDAERQAQLLDLAMWFYNDNYIFNQMPVRTCIDFTLSQGLFHPQGPLYIEDSNVRNDILQFLKMYTGDLNRILTQPLQGEAKEAFEGTTGETATKIFLSNPALMNAVDLGPFLKCICDEAYHSDSSNKMTKMKTVLNMILKHLEEGEQKIYWQVCRLLCSLDPEGRVYDFPERSHISQLIPRSESDSRVKNARLIHGMINSGIDDFIPILSALALDELFTLFPVLTCKEQLSQDDFFLPHSTSLNNLSFLPNFIQAIEEENLQHYADFCINHRRATGAKTPRIDFSIKFFSADLLIAVASGLVSVKNTANRDELLAALMERTFFDGRALQLFFTTMQQHPHLRSRIDVSKLIECLPNDFLAKHGLLSALMYLKSPEKREATMITFFSSLLPLSNLPDLFLDPESAVILDLFLETFKSAITKCDIYSTATQDVLQMFLNAADWAIERQKIDQPALLAAAFKERFMGLLMPKHGAAILESNYYQIVPIKSTGHESGLLQAFPEEIVLKIAAFCPPQCIITVCKTLRASAVYLQREMWTRFSKSDAFRVLTRGLSLADVSKKLHRFRNKPDVIVKHLADSGIDLKALIDYIDVLLPELKLFEKSNDDDVIVELKASDSAKLLLAKAISGSVPIDTTIRTFIIGLCECLYDIDQRELLDLSRHIWRDTTINARKAKCMSDLRHVVDIWPIAHNCIAPSSAGSENRSLLRMYFHSGMLYRSFAFKDCTFKDALESPINESDFMILDNQRRQRIICLYGQHEGFLNYYECCDWEIEMSKYFFQAKQVESTKRKQNFLAFNLANLGKANENVRKLIFAALDDEERVDLIEDLLAVGNESDSDSFKFLATMMLPINRAKIALEIILGSRKCMKHVSWINLIKLLCPDLLQPDAIETLSECIFLTNSEIRIIKSRLINLSSS